MAPSYIPRPPRNFGDVELSVQASRFAYCEPRADLPEIEQYEAVEVAMFLNGLFVSPSDLGLPQDLGPNWTSGDVEGYYPVGKLALLEAALRERLEGLSPAQILQRHEARLEVERSCPLPQ